MNEKTIWVSTEDGMIFPNEKFARKGYQEWCKENGEEFDEETFRDFYREVTFDFYNRNYV